MYLLEINPFNFRKNANHENSDNLSTLRYEQP